MDLDFHKSFQKTKNFHLAGMSLSPLVALSLHIFNFFLNNISNHSFLILDVSYSSFYTLFNLVSCSNIKKLPFIYLMHNLKEHEIRSFLLFQNRCIPFGYEDLKSLLLPLQLTSI